MDTTLEETGAQIITTGLVMDHFDNSPYSLMLLNNEI